MGRDQRLCLCRKPHDLQNLRHAIEQKFTTIGVELCEKVCPSIPEKLPEFATTANCLNTLISQCVSFKQDDDVLECKTLLCDVSNAIFFRNRA